MPDQPVSNPLDIFPKLFGEIDVGQLLQLGNGLAFLTLLLAAILIAMAIFADIQPSTKKLINSFLFISVFFVIFSSAPAYIGLFRGGATVIVHITHTKIPSTDENFPIHIIHNGQSVDILKDRFEANMVFDENYIYINASEVAKIIDEKSRQITEFLEKLQRRDKVVQPEQFSG